MKIGDKVIVVENSLGGHHVGTVGIIAYYDQEGYPIIIADYNGRPNHELIHRPTDIKPYSNIRKRKCNS